jgi:hypothetical protein
MLEDFVDGLRIRGSPSFVDARIQPEEDATLLALDDAPRSTGHSSSKGTGF